MIRTIDQSVEWCIQRDVDLRFGPRGDSWQIRIYKKGCHAAFHTIVTRCSLIEALDEAIKGYDNKLANRERGK